MDRLDLLLKEFDFTKYEAQTLETLIKYNVLSARDIHKYSRVPQPKIYETILQLQEKGLVDVIYRKRKKLFMVKPKEVIKEYLIEYTRRIKKVEEKSTELIDKIYRTEEAIEIPFMGVAGLEAIRDYIYILADTAEESFYSFFPLKFFDKKIFSLLMAKAKELDIKIVLLEEIDDGYTEIYKDLTFYKLKSPAFEVIKDIIYKIEQFLPPQQNKAYSFQVIKNLALNIKDIFGIIVIDGKKSFFNIPIPVQLPMAILSSLPELVEFHV
ncbi:MAG: TrmB family transcriptional regulator, partial [Candidatus Hermodarchaeota archaeon]